ncbi:amidohydrolase family protein [Microbacterium sp. NPDC055312]
MSIAGQHGGKILLKGCGFLYADRGSGAEISQGTDLLISDGRVAAIGGGCAPSGVDRVIDASRWIVVPGLVNTHHHLSQQLTRTEAFDCGLVDWLSTLYPVWRHMTQADAYVSALVGIAELVLSGCTTVGDFTYYYPRGGGDILGEQVRAAAEIGCRFAPVRGGMVELEAAVRERIGTRLDSSIESRADLIDGMHDAIDRFHDPRPDAMVKVGVGLTEKAYGDPSIMREIAALSGDHDVKMHTHLHPRPDERRHAETVAGMSPIDYLDETGWLSERLWVAHGTGLTASDLTRFATAGVGLSLNPSSNARFGLPIASGMLAHELGVRVSVGVDGAASSDSGNELAELRLVMQTQRIQAGVDEVPFHRVTADTMFQWATVNGAQTLGWAGSALGAGELADLAAFPMDSIEFVGARDPLAALLLCAGGKMRADTVIVGGRIIVADGQLLSHDESELARSGRAASEALWERSR